MSDRKYTMAEIDLEGVERLIAKLPSTIPGKLKKIPTVEQKDELLSKIKGNAVWLILLVIFIYMFGFYPEQLAWWLHGMGFALIAYALQRLIFNTLIKL